MNMTRFFSVFLLGVCLTNSSNAQDRLPEGLIRELDAMFETARLDLRAPGLVYGVVSREGMLHVRSYGVRDLESGAPVTEKTAFRIASMTKMMTALLVQDLSDEGRISLDEPAEKYVPPLAAWTYPTTDSRKVVIRDLLNHTAGFVTDDPWADRQLGVSAETLDAYLAEANPFSHAPGSHYEYSNLGYVILGRIIETVTGQPFGERLRERILAPLRLMDTRLDGNSFEEDAKANAYNWTDDEFEAEPFLPSGAFDPLGGIWTTARDYQAFISWMLSAWPPRNEPEVGVIPRRVIRSVTDSQRLQGPYTRPGLTGLEDCVMGSAYANGLSVTAHCTAGLLIGHGGGFPGYGTYVLMNPGMGFGMFAFVNHTYGKPHRVVWEAVARLIDSGHFAADRHYLESDPGLMQAYAGIQAAFREKDIEAGDLQFANNFFLDRSRQRWNQQIDALNSEAGECETGAVLENDGRLSGKFEWVCETARIRGRLVMSPISPPAVQYLKLHTITLDNDGREIVTDYDFH